MTLDVLIQQTVLKENGKRKLSFQLNIKEIGQPDAKKYIQSIEGVVSWCRKHDPDKIYLQVNKEDYFKFWILYNNE